MSDLILAFYEMIAFTFSSASPSLNHTTTLQTSCTANLQQGWPKLVNSIFFTTSNGSIAIGIIAPASTTINGVAVTISTVRVGIVMKPERCCFQSLIPSQ